MYIGFLMQARLLWELQFKKYVKFDYIVAPYVALMAIMMYLDYKVVHVYNQGNLMVWYESPLASAIYGWIVISFLVPLAWYFLREAFRSGSWKTRLKSVVFSFGYTAIAATSGVGSILYNRADTDTSAWITIFVFVVMLGVLLLTYIPVRKIKV
jgi:hypothetical protein